MGAPRGMAALHRPGPRLIMRAMATAPKLQSFVESELGHSADLIDRTVVALQALLRQPPDGPAHGQDRQHPFELAQALARHQVTFQRRFVDALRDAVVAEMAPHLESGAAPLSSGLGGLQLMDETRVESEIGLSRAIQEIDAAAEWELRELQTFTSALRGQEHVTAESNPLRPRAYAQALSEAAAALPITPAQQALLVRLAATAIAPLLKKAWAAASTRLERKGITPSIYRTVVFAPGSTRAAADVNVTQPGALDALRRTMPDTPPAAPAAAGAGAGAGAAGAPLDFADALARVDALLSRKPAAPAPAPRLLEHRAALLASTGASVERQIIELIARLFEVIVTDPGLNPVLRAQVGRLQVSALRIALADPEMLDDHAHPVWAFMARLVTAAGGYPNPGDPRLGALLTRSDALVADLAAQSRTDGAPYALALAQLDQFLEQQLQDQQDAARPTLQTLLRAEQTDQLQQQISVRLADQLAGVHTTPVVRRFITGAWARVLAVAMLAHGDASEVTGGYVKALEDLVWSLQPGTGPGSRPRLLALLPGLLQKLRAGMASIDLPAAERQAVLDDLVAAHTEALRPGGRPQPATEEPLSPEEIVRRLREEDDASADATPFADSLIDLASMDTVPAALIADAPATPEEDAGDWVAGLSAGVRQRIFLNGRWTQAQLLWHSPRGSYFVYAGEVPGRTHSVTRRALERLRSEDLVDTLTEAAVVQRAVDALLRRIDGAA